MHVIAAHRPRVTLFADDGRNWSFDSLEHARRELGMRFIRERVGPHFVVARVSYVPVPSMGTPIGWSASYLVPSWRHERFAHVMRDDTGRVLVAADFAPARKRSNWWLRRTSMYERWNGVGPVPGVHKLRSTRWLRRLAHIGAHKQAAQCLPEEGEVPVRAARNVRNLVDPWDDIQRHRERNWKSQRNTQWKCKKSEEPSARRLGREGLWG